MGLLMTVIARALVLAVQYIADRNQDVTEDDDVMMLEHIAALLGNATASEQTLLIEAAQECNLPAWSAQIGLDPR